MTTLTSTSTGWFSQLSEQDFDLLARVDAGAWVVLQVLRWFARDKSMCYPSVETIGKLARLRERSVHHALKRLLKAGLIERDAHRGKATTYRLLGYVTGCTPSNGRYDAGVSKGMTPVSVTHDAGVSKGMTPVSDKVEALKKTQEIEKKKKTKRGCAAVVSFPSELDSDSFKEAWDRWMSYRRDRRLTCTSATLQGQLRKLAGVGLTSAVQEIDNSIDNGWQSVCYKPGANGKPTGNYAAGPGQQFDPNHRSTTPIVGGF